MAAERAYHRLAFQMASDYGSFGAGGGGYDGATSSSMRDDEAFSTSFPLSEDQHLGAYYRSNLRLNGRWLQRNDPIVAGLLRRFSENIVASGITATPETDDPLFNDEVSDFWDDYKQTCDVRGRESLDDICRIIIESRPIEGETGIVKLADGRIQPVEAERIATPNGNSSKQVFDGVKTNAFGQIESWFVCPRGDAGQVDTRRAEEVLAREFIHCVRRGRFDSVRGIPDLAPILDTLKDFQKLHKYTINKAKLDSLEGWGIFTKEGGIPKNLIKRHIAAGGTTDDTVDEKTPFGRFRYFQRGDDMKPLASATPNQQYKDFATLILRIIAQYLGVPYEFLMLHFSDSSFNGAFAAILQTNRTLENWHIWLTQKFLKPLWNWRIAMAIRDRDIRPAPLDRRGMSTWSWVRWSIPEFGWIDPKQKVDSQRSRWNLCQESLDEMARRSGQTGQDRIDLKKEDLKRLAKAAAELRREDGLGDVTWRDIMSAEEAGVAPAPVVKDAKAEGKKAA